MFRLNLKIALRNIWRHKLTTSIKLIGLIVGLSTVVLLVAYVMFELSYDRYNQNAKNIYRLQAIDMQTQKENIHLPSGLANMMKEEIPGVKSVTQLRSNKSQFKIGDHFFNKDLLLTENSFFQIFTAPLLIGDAKSALKKPNEVLISESFAKVAFPTGSAIGQSITLVNDPKAYQVVGIMKDLPKPSHFHADVVMNAGLSSKLNWSSYSSIPQYIELDEGGDPALIAQKLKSLYKKYEFPEDIRISLMPLTKIHLYSHTSAEIEPNSDIKYVYIFSIVAFFILLIAIVNFINLTVAASLKRGKEIGVKKVMGASVAQLRMQFLSESYLYFIFSALLVLILTHDLIPLIGSKIGIDISLEGLFNFKSVAISILIIIIAGFIAGLYPAIILSKLMPVKTLKGAFNHNEGKFSFKKILMVFQFSISAFLIVCTLVIYAQMQYIQNKNLGFDKDQVLISTFNSFGDGYVSFKEELLQHQSVKSVSSASFDPGKSFGSSSSWSNDKDTTKYEMDFINADFDFIKTLNIKVVKGRAFSKEHGTDVYDYDKLLETLPAEEYKKVWRQKPILLNEAAVELLKLKNPIDTVLAYGGLQGKVIGVLSDFNGMSLHNKVTPLAMQVEQKNRYGYLYVKIDQQNVAQTKALVENIWKKHFPNAALEIQFMDEHLQQLYLSEMRLGSTFISFAGIAIFLCCIGLFGMVYYDLQQRTKEIAVRKILGASVKDLLALLNSSFVKVVVIANVIIWPIAYYLIREWLNGFYYRIDISYVPFTVALLICLLLTLFTVSLQAIKTLRKSPVDALKYE